MNAQKLTYLIVNTNDLNVGKSSVLTVTGTEEL